MKEKVCPQCGKKFTAHGRQILCNSCAFNNFHPKKFKKCEICGKEMQVQNVSRKYCYDCKNKKIRDYQHNYWVSVRKKRSVIRNENH